MTSIYRRGLIAAALALGCISAGQAQESAGEYWAKEAALHPASMTVPRVGRKPRQIRPAASVPASGIAGYAARFVGRSGPSLGLPSRLWCADFATMVLRATGYRAVASRRAYDMARAGPRIARPQVGALAITSRRGGGHVSIVAAVYPDGSFLSINGNGSGRRVTMSIRSARAIFVMPQRA